MSDWPILAIEQYPVEIIDGDRGAEYPKVADFAPSGYCLFLNAGNVTADGFALDQCAFISRKRDSLLRKGRLARNDIVLTTRGTVGNFAFFDVRVPFEHVRINSGMVILRADTSKLMPRYFYFAVQSPTFRHQIRALTSGSAQPQLPIRDIRKLRLPLPPMIVQEGIVDVVGAIQDKIELNRRMNETLEAMAQAIFRDWFVDFGPTRRKIEGATDPMEIMGGLVADANRARELADLFSAIIGDNGLPVGWEERTIYEETKVIYGAPFASKQFNTLGIGRPLARIRDLPNHFGGLFTEERHPKEYTIRPGDIVVGMDGEFRAYLWHGVDTLLNQRVCCFAPHEMENRAFVYFSIKPLLERYESSAVGTTVIHLGKKDIDRFVVAYPGNALKAAFAAIAQPLMARLVANGEQIRTLTATRDLLLPKLMSGEIRLDDARPQAEEAA